MNVKKFYSEMQAYEFYMSLMTGGVLCKVVEMPQDSEWPWAVEYEQPAKR